jgi:hypothetical protein
LPLPVRAALPAVLQRKFVYTGITRGKKLVLLIGQRKALAMAVRNNRTENRFWGCWQDGKANPANALVALCTRSARISDFDGPPCPHKW